MVVCQRPISISGAIAIDGVCQSLEIGFCALNHWVRPYYMLIRNTVKKNPRSSTAEVTISEIQVEQMDKNVKGKQNPT